MKIVIWFAGSSHFQYLYGFVTYATKAVHLCLNLSNRMFVMSNRFFRVVGWYIFLPILKFLKIQKFQSFWKNPHMTLWLSCTQTVSVSTMSCNTSLWYRRHSLGRLLVFYFFQNDLKFWIFQIFKIDKKNIVAHP